MRQSDNCHVLGPVESECEGVKLTTASGSPTRVGGDAMLECVRESRRSNVKFLDADVQRPLASASAVADGKRTWWSKHQKAHTHGPGARKNLGAQARKLSQGEKT